MVQASRPEAPLARELHKTNKKVKKVQKILFGKEKNNIFFKFRPFSLEGNRKIRKKQASNQWKNWKA